MIFRARRAGVPASASSISAGPVTLVTSPSPVPSRTGPGDAGTGAAAPGSAPHTTIPLPGPGSSSRFPDASFQIAGIAITSARPAAASRAGSFRRRGSRRGPGSPRPQARRRRAGVT